MQTMSDNDSPLEESNWTPEYYYSNTLFFGTNGGDWFKYWSQIYEISQPDTNDKLEYWQVYLVLDHYLGADSASYTISMWSLHLPAKRSSECCHPRKRI